MNSSSSQPVAPKSKNWLLAKSRQWHLWGGLIAGLFLLIVAATGIVLNYKKPIFSALGLERDLQEMKASDPDPATPAKRETGTPRLTTATGLTAAPVPEEQALALAREQWGEVALERIELKDEQGTLLYKIKNRAGAELQVNALTGSHFVKGKYEKIKTAPDGAVTARTTDWGTLMLDLHTGKIGGEVGKALMTIAAVVMLLLTLSGVYMWLKPLLIRRQNAKARAAASRSTGGALTPAPVAPAVARPAKPELVAA